MMGPIEQSETSPKLSFDSLESERIDETPTPSAMINGTVIGPVVTPPASKAIAQNSLSTNEARIKTMA